MRNNFGYNPALSCHKNSRKLPEDHQYTNCISLSLTETASALLRLPQPHWGCLILTDIHLKLLCQHSHTLADSTMLPHSWQYPAIFEETIKIVKCAWGTLRLNFHICLTKTAIVNFLIYLAMRHLRCLTNFKRTIPHGNWDWHPSISNVFWPLFEIIRSYILSSSSPDNEGSGEPFPNPHYKYLKKKNFIPPIIVMCLSYQ